MSRASPVLADQLRFLQELEVLRHSWAAHGHLARQLAHRQRFVAQQSEQRTTGRVCQDRKHGKIYRYLPFLVSHN